MKLESVIRNPVSGLQRSASADVFAARSSVSRPKVSRLLLSLFTWYSRRYIRRHFHSLRVSRTGLPTWAEGQPLVIYSNHASWWDALVCFVLQDEFFRDRKLFAPIDAAMLKRYRFFGRLGFFGVEQHTRRGAMQFLQNAEPILQSPQNLLAITPQGRFADVRERPIRFSTGLGHLATRAKRVCFTPVAIEYAFWEERLPEILIRFGETMRVIGHEHAACDAKYWTTMFEQKLTDAQDALAAEVQRRCPDEFEVLLRGGAGQGGVYDAWHWFKAKMRGKTFKKEHGNK